MMRSALGRVGTAGVWIFGPDSGSSGRLAVAGYKMNAHGNKGTGYFRTQPLTLLV